MRRGSTMVEVLVGISIFTVVFLGCASLLITGLRTNQRQGADLDMVVDAGQATRKITEAVRDAMSVSITNEGRTLNYTLPAYSSTADSTTGESELRFPLVSDGVARSFTCQNGTLTNERGATIVTNILSVDPDRSSSQYNKPVGPFTLTTIGSRWAITVNLIVGRTVDRSLRYSRMKTTVVVRNAQ